ncbi:unnamed protein product [Brassica napus]|uniref:(rape) hypothetical protein n=1 Tax=Brassica napus TaxID=3708 RepID=A0A816UN04_BRANA|nr:unnamed protein product [Brassica napus]
MKITREHGESLDLLPSSGIVYVKAKEKFPSPSLSASSPSSTQQEIIFSVPTTTASKVMDFLEYGQELSVNVTDVTTRGYEVCFGPLRGFLPYNQLVHASKFGSFQAWAKPDLKDPSRHQKKSFVHSFVGNTLSVRVLTADKSTGILILTMKPVEGVEGLELNGSDAAIRKSSSPPREGVEEALRKHFASRGIKLIHASAPEVDYRGTILCRFALIYVNEEDGEKALKLDGSCMLQDLVRVVFPRSGCFVFGDGCCVVYLHGDAIGKALKLSGGSVGGFKIVVHEVLPIKKVGGGGVSNARTLAMAEKDEAARLAMAEKDKAILCEGNQKTITTTD